MSKTSKNNVYLLAVLFGVLQLTACNSSSSSPTVPSSESVYYMHNLVFKNHSTLLSTGYNAFGQLGDGNLDNRSVVGPISTSSRFIDFATGGNFSIALRSDGTMMSWGFNSFGQLGYNNTNYSSSPQVVGTVVAGVPFTGVKAIANGAIAAGVQHTLALKDDDTVWAWGNNIYGQLGQTTTPINSFSMIPMQVAKPPGFTNISSVAANGYHSIARANGNVWAWGYNQAGQLGVPNAPPSYSATPTQVAGLSGITAIAAGGSFNYALDSNGNVWSWGNNDSGQLGDGSFTFTRPATQRVMQSQKQPLDALPVPPITNTQPLGTTSRVVKVVAGKQHGLALLADGTVWSWGYNLFGQLGTNTPPDSPVAVQVLDPTGTVQLSGVSDIRAFGNSSLARIGDVWYAWGQNSFGQLGINSTGYMTLPVRMTGF